MFERGSVITFCLLLCAGQSVLAQMPEEKIVRILRTSNKAQTNHYVAKA